jgi:elongation factor P
MPLIEAGAFKKGIKVILDGEPYEMIDMNFVKPGKGQALYKCRLRCLTKNTILDRTYKSGDGLEAADVRKGDAQYLYRERMNYVFMDLETFEQYSLAPEMLGDAARFLMDGMTCNLLFWNDQPIGISLPQHVNLKVTAAEPAVRGNTSSNITKRVTLETGAEVNAPAFIDVGETIRINTETGDYMERVKT